MFAKHEIGNLLLQIKVLFNVRSFKISYQFFFIFYIFLVRIQLSILSDQDSHPPPPQKKKKILKW